MNLKIIQIKMIFFVYTNSLFFIKIRMYLIKYKKILKTCKIIKKGHLICIFLKFEYKIEI